MKKLVLFSLFCLSMIEGTAQKYLVFFKGKAQSGFSTTNPSAFLSQRAIDRRQRYNIAIDSTDLPVPAAYLDSLRNIPGIQILNISRWLNSVSVYLSDQAAVERINQLPFVIRQQRVANSVAPNRRSQKIALGTAIRKKKKLPAQPFGTTGNVLQYGLSEGQVSIHNGQFLHNIGLQGQGMRMGMLDAGFYRYTTLPAFDSVRASGRILDTWDFVALEPSVTEDDTHGMHCFSIIVANMPGQLVGTAPYASFYLYRSEDAASETLIEEHNWVCAAERVDSAGGDLISSSLGYYHFDNAADNYRYQDMDGNTTISARGADLAAKKGILVVNAAGNAGNSSWKYIITPADGDSVLAVGAVNVRGQVGSFSSYGPSADGQVKPDVASVGVGTYVQAHNGNIASGNGTSYAAPNIAGLAACLWQGFPEVNNMAVVDALRQSGNSVSAPNNRTGYGIPDVKKALGILLKQYTTANLQVQGCRATLSWQSKDMNAMHYQVERRAPGEATFTKIAEQAGSGTSFGNRSYQFTEDLHVFGNGTLSYRILQVVDTSAANPLALYIDTVSTNLNAPCGQGGRFNIAPNPVPQQFLLQANFEEPIDQLHLSIVNSLGQQVQVLRLSKPAGNANLPINVSNLAAGKYYIRVFHREELLATLEFLKL